MVEEQLQAETPKVIIGGKEFEKYLAAVIFQFQESDVVELSAIGSNINKMERIVKLFSKFNVIETNRRNERFENLSCVVCRLSIKRL